MFGRIGFGHSMVELTVLFARMLIACKSEKAKLLLEKAQARTSLGIESLVRLVGEVNAEYEEALIVVKDDQMSAEQAQDLSNVLIVRADGRMGWGLHLGHNGVEIDLWSAGATWIKIDAPNEQQALPAMEAAGFPNPADWDLAAQAKHITGR